MKIWKKGTPAQRTFTGGNRDASTAFFRISSSFPLFSAVPTPGLVLSYFAFSCSSFLGRNSVREAPSLAVEYFSKLSGQSFTGKRLLQDIDVCF